MPIGPENNQEQNSESNETISTKTDPSAETLDEEKIEKESGDCLKINSEAEHKIRKGTNLSI